MPLVHSASRGVVGENIRRELEAGKPQRQAVAIALHTQDDARKHHHGNKTMAENASHAPGHEISGEGGSVRQRNRMGTGKGAMPSETFGIGKLPGTEIMQNHGAHMPHDGVHLRDHERSGPPAIDMGKGMMDATHHSHHGPHHHHD